MDPRDEVQRKAREEWLRKRNGTLVLGTGMGKSKVAIDIVKDIQPSSVLILTNSETLRDSTWRNEFVKFGAEEYWDVHVQSECYQTAYKWVGKAWSLVIADEIDAAMTPEYSKFFLNNGWNNLLGLTGFVDESKLELLNSICPIIFTYTTRQGQSDGLLNKSKFKIIGYPLSRTKDIKVTMRKAPGFFYKSANDDYKYWHGKFMAAVMARDKAQKQIKTIDLLPKDSVSLSMEDAIKAESSAAWALKLASRKRKEVLWKSKNGVVLAKRLIDRILSMNDSNKVLTFSKLTSQADAINGHAYHTKNGMRNLDLEMFNRGDIRSLGACEALNRGVNLVGVNYLISESYDGSETYFQQKHGRGTRLDVEDFMTYIILLPYYEDMVPIVEKDVVKGRRRVFVPTQAQVWKQNMLDSFNLSSSEEEFFLIKDVLNDPLPL